MMKYFPPTDFKPFICSPACLSAHIHVGSSVCLLDGPLCRSATNGHCWASHFLNDTLLRSIRLPYSYTPPQPQVSTTPSDVHVRRPCEKKSGFSSISPQYFPLNTPLVERTSSCLTHTLGHLRQRLNERPTACDWSILSLTAASAPSRSICSFSPLLVFIFLITLTFLPAHVFVYLCARRWRSMFPLFQAAVKTYGSQIEFGLSSTTATLPDWILDQNTLMIALPLHTL